MPKLGLKDQNTLDWDKSRRILLFVRVSFDDLILASIFDNLENPVDNFNSGHEAESKAKTTQASNIG